MINNNNNLLCVPEKEKPAIILHYEDTAGWIDNLRHICNNNGYLYINKYSINENTLDEIIEIDSDTILVFDLQLDENDPQSKNETVTYLLEKAPYLIQRNIEIIILSGRIKEDDEEKLNSDGGIIYFFNKTSFERQIFLEVINKINNRINLLYGSSENLELFEIMIDLESKFEFKDGIFKIFNVENCFKFETLILENNMSLVDTPLTFMILCDFLEIERYTGVLRLGNEKLQQKIVRFIPKSSKKLFPITILFFRKNHLLRDFKFYFNILD